jgi:thiosulfate/3-mercaptopyruvate sulfurtransferase
MDTMVKRRQLLAGAAAWAALAACKGPQSDATGGGPAPSGEPAALASLEPADLAARLADANAAKPRLVHVGPTYLFGKGHIPGSVWGGEGGEAEGIARLTGLAKDWARDAETVVYCGCCPMWRCPNVRPAVKALRSMGFTRVEALNLSTTLRDDWTNKGYPVERGEPRAG